MRGGPAEYARRGATGATDYARGRRGGQAVTAVRHPAQGVAVPRVRSAVAGGAAPPRGEDGGAHTIPGRLSGLSAKTDVRDTARPAAWRP